MIELNAIQIISSVLSFSRDLEIQVLFLILNNYFYSLYFITIFFQQLANSLLSCLCIHSLAQESDNQGLISIKTTSLILLAMVCILLYII